MGDRPARGGWPGAQAAEDGRRARSAAGTVKRVPLGRWGAARRRAVGGGERQVFAGASPPRATSGLVVRGRADLRAARRCGVVGREPSRTCEASSGAVLSSG